MRPETLATSSSPYPSILEAPQVLVVPIPHTWIADMLAKSLSPSAPSSGVHVTFFALCVNVQAQRFLSPRYRVASFCINATDFTLCVGEKICDLWVLSFEHHCNVSLRRSPIFCPSKCHNSQRRAFNAINATLLRKRSELARRVRNAFNYGIFQKLAPSISRRVQTDERSSATPFQSNFVQWKERLRYGNRLRYDCSRASLTGLSSGTPKSSSAQSPTEPSSSSNSSASILSRLKLPGTCLEPAGLAMMKEEPNARLEMRAAILSMMTASSTGGPRKTVAAFLTRAEMSWTVAEKAQVKHCRRLSAGRECGPGLLRRGLLIQKWPREVRRLYAGGGEGSGSSVIGGAMEGAPFCGMSSSGTVSFSASSVSSLEDSCSAASVISCPRGSAAPAVSPDSVPALESGGLGGMLVGTFCHVLSLPWSALPSTSGGSSPSASPSKPFGIRILPGVGELWPVGCIWCLKIGYIIDFFFGFRFFTLRAFLALFNLRSFLCLFAFAAFIALRRLLSLLSFSLPLSLPASSCTLPVTSTSLLYPGSSGALVLSADQLQLFHFFPILWRFTRQFDAIIGPAAIARSVAFFQGMVPPAKSPPAGRGDPMLLDGRDPGPDVLNLIMFAFGWTYSVSIPSAAPISAVGAVCREVVCILDGTVKDRFVDMRLGAADSGVEGMVADMVVVVMRLTEIGRGAILRGIALRTSVLKMCDNSGWTVVAEPSIACSVWRFSAIELS
ncbi:hypothetical protein KC345_g287 [Hortaea werneckii]|nr:hypothetical protein KC345_g287 [Hortaea werneckii]